MTKKEFIKRIKKMEHPVMQFGSTDYPFLNLYCSVFDKKNLKNKFQAFYCRLSRNEYYRNDLEPYYEREYKLQSSFSTWLINACGKKKCTIRETRI